MKPIQNYEGYFITEDGQVWSDKTKKFLKQKELKGYKYVGLCSKGKVKNMFVHRLVASEFLDKLNYKYMPYENKEDINIELLEINHIDENTSNNNVCNLEWCTPKYNANFGNRNNKIKANSKKEVDKKTRDKISKTLKEKYSDKERHPMYGYKYNEQQRTNSSISKCKHYYPDRDSFKVAQYTKDGELIRIYDSLAQAVKEINSNHISQCINGKRKTAGGFVWKWA